MSSRQWQRLALVYLERARRPIAISIATLVPTSLLFASKHGFQPIDVVANLSLVAAMMPLALGGIVARSKADGSLAFIASLPVSATEHARSWLAVVVLLCLPVAAAASAVGYMAPLSLRGIPLVVGALSATAFAIGFVMFMNAMQLSASPSRAGVYFICALCGVVSLISGISRLLEVPPALVLQIVSSEWFLPALSALSWIISIGAFWWAWRRIGHFMTSYVGEPPKA